MIKSTRSACNSHTADVRGPCSRRYYYSPEFQSFRRLGRTRDAAAAAERPECKDCISETDCTITVDDKAACKLKAETTLKSDRIPGRRHMVAVICTTHQQTLQNYCSFENCCIARIMEVQKVSCRAKTTSDVKISVAHALPGHWISRS